MIKIDIELEQLYDCSEQFLPEVYWLSTQKKRNSSQTYGRSRPRNLKRFSNQALHSLWKARVQVCEWAWPWSQILSISQSTWAQTGAELRTSKIPETSESVSRKLSETKENIRRNLQHQSRDLAPQRALIEDRDEYCRQLVSSCRCRGNRQFSHQHAPRPLKRSSRGHLLTGGKR